jgi:3-hydroxybutyryl-CoA dehydratase
MIEPKQVNKSHPGAVGDVLPELARLVTQKQVDNYAEASGDFNPIHIDEHFASATQFGGRIAHGMLLLAFVSEMMDQAFPTGWANGGKLKVRFKSPVYPGENISTYGQVLSVNGSTLGPVAKCRIGCRKEDGTDAVTGHAFVPIGVRGEPT